ncbi:MAG: ATP-grasp domain-containing protein [Candidatus Bathyarchaeia archaeon]
MTGLEQLKKTEIRKLLVTGVDTVFVAASARSAGYDVYVADYFGDVDLQRFCSEFTAVIKQEKGKSCGRMQLNFKPEAFLEMAKILGNKHKVDAILLSSGLDDYFDVLCELNSLIPILGNSPEIIKRVREKQRFFKELELLGIPYPETKLVGDVFEAKASAAKIGYPVVIKPTSGFGGAGARLALNDKEIEKTFREVSQESGSVLIQKFIEGIHASISILAGDKNIRVVSINEQLLGLPSVFQREPFGYCGNIVPLRLANSIFEKCKSIAEKIAFHFDLRGSNGVDIVISKDGTPYVVEVNPRFQGTLGCVERVLGINMVEAHVKACLYGEMPTIRKASRFCTRLILYAPKRVVVPDLTAFPNVWDIPLPNSIIEEGEPLCSVLTEAKSRDASFRKAEEEAELIYDGLRSV